MRAPFTSVSSIFPPLWQFILMLKASKLEYQISKIWFSDPILMSLPSKLGLHGIASLFICQRSAEIQMKSFRCKYMLLWKLRGQWHWDKSEGFLLFCFWCSFNMTGIIDGLNKCIWKDESPAKERMCNLFYVDHHCSKALKSNVQSLALLLVKRCITTSKSSHWFIFTLHSMKKWKKIAESQ